MTHSRLFTPQLRPSSFPITGFYSTFSTGLFLILHLFSSHSSRSNKLFFRIFMSSWGDKTVPTFAGPAQTCKYIFMSLYFSSVLSTISLLWYLTMAFLLWFFHRSRWNDCLKMDFQRFSFPIIFVSTFCFILVNIWKAFKRQANGIFWATEKFSQIFFGDKKVFTFFALLPLSFLFQSFWQENCSQYLAKDVQGSSSWITDSRALQRTPVTFFETRALPYLVTQEVHPEPFFGWVQSEL